MKWRTVQAVCVLPALLLAVTLLTVGNHRRVVEINRLRQETTELQATLAATQTEGSMDSRSFDNLQLQELRDQISALHQRAAEPSSDGAELKSALEERERLRQAGDQLKAVRSQGNCLSNLLMLDKAKQAWAAATTAEKRGIVTLDDVRPWLPDGLELQCPSGGHYSINRIGSAPACSISGHCVP
jgi:hypothetical protein